VDGSLAGGSMMISCAALFVALVVHGTTGTGSQGLSYGAWSRSHEGGIAIEFLVDRLSLGFAALSAAIAGIVAAFSNRYLHREPGYNRYFCLLAMFVTGMLLVALAGNVAVLFIGWELVGLSSALLVAFFHERPAAVSNALRVVSVYRISDAAMLSAAVLLRHVAGSDSLALLFGSGATSTIGLTETNATIIAVLLIVAVAGKSALLPFSSWLPRAMEGPTPSSAVYYGSLSIHAGCFLLLRAAPLLEQAPAARLLAGGLGAATAVFAGITTRVQSDVKSSLAYASLTQVGIIVVEIAIGWYTIAFIHLAGHACFRLLQFLSAPNVLHDLHGMEDALGDRSSHTGGYLEVVTSDRVRRLLFLIALERGFLDSLLDRVVVEPFTRLARQLTRLDEWLCDAVLPTRRPVAFEGREDRDE
jgi:NAD(P)H-quinone oxidoreductase subunit 5